MSVVNKMLQDLESRKKRTGISADYVPNEPNLFKPWMLGVSVCAVSAAILLSQVNWSGIGEPNLYTQQLPPPAFVASEQINTPVLAQNNLIPADATPIEQTAITTKELVETALPNSTALVQTSQREKKPAVATPPKVAPTAAVIAKNGQENEPSEPTGEFSVAPSNGSKAGISSLREQARIALNNDDIKGAIESLETLIAEYPEDSRARKQLASLLFSHNGIERAYRVLNDGLVLSPADNPMRVMLARVAFKTGNFQDAHNALSQHPYPNLADVELISFRAALAERLSQYENAYHDYKLLVSREPNNAKWWLGLGVSQDKLKRAKPALESYRQAKALKQLPTEVDSFVDQRIAALARQS